MSKFPGLSKAKQKLLKFLGIEDDEREEVEPDQELLQLLNLNPWEPADRQKFDELRVYEYIKQNPSSLKALYRFPKAGRGSRPNYPLNRIISLGASLKTIQKAHKLFPSAMNYVHPESRTTPLHVACVYSSPLEVIQFLLEEIPDAVRQPNSNVFLPLHNACQASIPNPASLEVIQVLVEAYPGALIKANKLGETPLKVAQRNQACLPEVIEFLSQQHIEEVLEGVEGREEHKRSSLTDETAGSSEFYFGKI